VVLASLPDASDLLRLLLDGGNSTKAGYPPARSGASGARACGRDSPRNEAQRIRLRAKSIF
jgi:hypothetical protein